MSMAWLIVVGIGAGIIFGGTYIALIAVVPILLGPYNKHESRTLIIAWSFFTVIAFALVSAISGTTTGDDILIALPGAVTYMLGAWLGSKGFRQSSDRKNMINIATMTLVTPAANPARMPNNPIATIKLASIHCRGTRPDRLVHK